MKKIEYVVILIVCSLFSFSSYAYVSGKKIADESLVYCPSQIICSSNMINSCKYNSNNSEYFGELKSKYNVAVGTYIFISAASSFHSNATSSSCTYQTGAYQNQLELQIRPETNLEASIPNPSYWIISGQAATCKSNYTSACPFKKKMLSLFVILI